MMGAEIGVMHFQDAGRDDKSRKTGVASPEAGKSKEIDSVLEPLEGTSPAKILTLEQ